ncbi:hypothetical protein EDB83DRAFT_2328125, partial [Lactarius deliciosus]
VVTVTRLASESSLEKNNTDDDDDTGRDGGNPPPVPATLTLGDGSSDGDGTSHAHPQQRRQRHGLHEGNSDFAATAPNPTRFDNNSSNSDQENMEVTQCKVPHNWVVRSASEDSGNNEALENDEEGENLCNCQFSLAYGNLPRSCSTPLLSPSYKGHATGCYCFIPVRVHRNLGDPANCHHTRNAQGESTSPVVAPEGLKHESGLELITAKGVSGITASRLRSSESEDPHWPLLYPHPREVRVWTQASPPPGRTLSSWARHVTAANMQKAMQGTTAPHLLAFIGIG